MKNSKGDTPKPPAVVTYAMKGSGLRPMVVHWGTELVGTPGRGYAT